MREGGGRGGGNKETMLHMSLLSAWDCCERGEGGVNRDRR